MKKILQNLAQYNIKIFLAQKMIGPIGTLKKNMFV